MQATRPSNNPTKILMLPWLAHGHISPYLELAKRLIKTFPPQTLHIHFCSTRANLASIKPKTLRNPNLSLVELRLPDLPDLPPRRHTTNALPPRLMPALKAAFDASASPNFAAILDEAKPNLVVFDFLQPWAAALAAVRGVPAVLFIGCAASAAAFGLCWGEELPFLEMVPRRCGVERLLGGAADRERVRRCWERSSGVVLVKTFAEIEGKYVDYLAALMGKKVLPVGSLVDDDDDDDDQDSDESEVMKWLNKKERSSVVFVSFGSECFPSKDDIREIAHGLELSKVSFIWVIRFPADEKTSIEESMPTGFLKRIGDKGMVVEGWAPQKEILKSESTGGFVSHCGWSSVMESMRFGVPIVAVPMHLDQPINARLVEEIGVGLEVKRDNVSGRISREELAKAVREVVAERGGESVRKAAAEMKERMRRKGDEEMEKVVKELMKICGKAN